MRSPGRSAAVTMATPPGSAAPLVLLAILAVLAGCAGAARSGPPGASPSDRPVRRPAISMTITAVPPAPGPRSCMQEATALPSLDPSAPIHLDDPRLQSLQVLTEKLRPTPRRPGVPEAAVPAAEACVYALWSRFLVPTDGGVPRPATIEAVLREVGLRRIQIRPGPAFTASTGEACIYGTFPAGDAAFTLGPESANGALPALTGPASPTRRANADRVAVPLVRS